jgi:hypothetical protein
MAFFTPVQLRVLKTSLILAILTWVLHLLPPSNGVDVFIKLITFAILPGWEFIISKRWKDLAIIGIVVCIFFTLQYSMGSYLQKVNPDNWVLLTHINIFMVYLLTIITRFHLMGTEKKIAAGVLAAFIYYFMPKTGNPLSSGGYFTGYAFGADDIYVIVSSLLVGWLKVICYYVIVFLIENGFKSTSFFEKLLSKVQIIHKWEYLFIWMAVCFGYMGCIGGLNTRLGVLFAGEQLLNEPLWMSLFFSLYELLFIYAGSLLLRNIITGRALTAGKYNPWLLLLHLVPVLNIIAVVICFFAEEKRGALVDNALDYVNVKRDIARKAMIIVPIVITAWNIYNMLVVPTGIRLVGISILAVMYLLKTGAYIKLPSGKIFVYVVIGLNVITIAYSASEYFIIYLSLIYLYYYFLLELFYPELEVEDKVQITEKAG